MPSPEYKPEWISEADACKWLGITRVTLYRWRTSKGLAWTNIDGRTVMYDKRQIEKMLNENSTYSILNEKKLAV